MTSTCLCSDRFSRIPAFGKCSSFVLSGSWKPLNPCVQQLRFPILFRVSGCPVASGKSFGLRSRSGSRVLKTRAESKSDDREVADDVDQSGISELLDPIAAVSEDGSHSSERAPSRIPYPIVTGLAVLGFLETTYLSWAKLSGAGVTCSVGGSCSDVLDSSYAFVFGVPLAFIGMIAYGAMAFLGGVRLSRPFFDWEEEEKWVRWLALGIATAMAAASAYLMYILVTELEGASCVFCVTSAVLSSALVLLALRGFTLKDIAAIAGYQTIVGLSVVFGLSVAYGDSSAARDLDLPSVEPEVYTMSSAREVSLAKHLRSVGARMYGAFWCSHCYEQKQKFGREAMQYVDYVECYPDGYRKGVQIAESCNAANIQGFPTWIIKGKILSGEQGLEDLARASGFDS